ncbi:MAG: hypothetical protein GX605_13695, partial [Chloroflexi bacterium]|nr:hypothetical protein [Chloroflexota bacterium]
MPPAFPSKPPILVQTRPELQRLAQRLLVAPRVGVDTESNGFYAYFERVCLVQFTVAEDDYVVDALAFDDLQPLAAVFASPAVEKIFHAAEFDIISLKRDYGFEMAHLFDTMLAARMLGWRRYGLANILAEQFGVQQDKRFQRVDWGRRPLRSEELQYARLDTHYLPALRDLEWAELQARGRSGQAREAFQRLTQVQGEARSFAPDGYLRLAGARDLDPQGLHVLRALYRLRDAEARRADRAPFRVIPDSALVSLSQSLPTAVEELAHVRALTPRLRGRFGSKIVKTVQEALQEPPHTPTRRRGSPPDPEAQERYESLREWRRQVAEGEGVEPDVILPNQVLKDLVDSRPRTREGLIAID